MVARLCRAEVKTFSQTGEGQTQAEIPPYSDLQQLLLRLVRISGPEIPPVGVQRQTLVTISSQETGFQLSRQEEGLPFIIIIVIV
jgi:hypothetical protein